MSDWKIRQAVPSDAKQLLEIYRPYVLDTAISFEYEVPSVEEFARRITNTLQRYPYLVVEDGGVIAGYAYASPFKERAAYDWSVEVSIYVRQDCTKKGYGAGLYHALEALLKKQHILNLNACIAYTDTEDEHLTNNSMQFHEHMGYRLVGKFRQCGYKFGKWYDMIWMEKMIGEHTQYPEKFLPFGQMNPVGKI
jgi:phosphinothricin acetyltransferase